MQRECGQTWRRAQECFRACAGIGHSPLSVISLKENEVLHYLKNTNYSLTKIAALLGFANVSHLWNFCIKMTGMPPNKIRENKVNQPAEEKT
ncbi:MAG: AraC family transcriptional regulator [Dysgonomonadaceae bacterium]|nr:AraC family transcriptional regulator [Dysgonamonadaceae bacterium]HQG68473.1 helix-turn-helix domain-containing protein [Paludibacteraceae bacterium]